VGQLEGVFGNAQGLGLGDDLQALHHSCHTLRRDRGRRKRTMGYSPIAEYFWLFPCMAPALGGALFSWFPSTLALDRLIPSPP
jgi:hypothetical protein